MWRQLEDIRTTEMQQRKRDEKKKRHRKGKVSKKAGRKLNK